MNKLSRTLKQASILGLSVMLSTAGLAVLLPQSAQAFAGGDGSWEDPYRVANCTQLQQVYSFENYDDYYDKSYVLTAHINCAEVAEFHPLYGNPEYSFSGHFNGRGYTIRNLNVGGSDYQAGLFGYAHHAFIENLNLENVTVNHVGKDDAGALVGVAYNTEIENVFAKNVDVSGRTNVGGLIGAVVTTQGEDIEIERVSASGSVSGTANNIGGLIGRINNQASNYVRVTEAFAEVEINTNGAHVGGLIGSITGEGNENVSNSWTRINNTYAWVTVPNSTADNVGGLIGSLSRIGNDTTYISVRESYAWTGEGVIDGDNAIGGLIGLIRSSTSNGWYAVEENFALAHVTATGTRGGLVGANNTTGGQLRTHFNYYDVGVAGVGLCDSGGTLTDDVEDGYFSCMPINVEGEAENYFINNNDNAPMDEWDFDDDYIWATQEDTPPIFYNFGIEPEDDEDTVDTITTGTVTDITPNGARVYGTAQLTGGYTIANTSINDGDLMLGFHFNTTQPVDWDNYTHTAPVTTVAPINGDDTHLSFYADYDELECETQYWYVAAYDHYELDAIGVANNVLSFTTAACDDDNDGVASDIEDAAPNGGDANNDGIQDSEQNYVTSLLTSAQNYVSVVVDDACALEEVGASSADTKPTQDSGYSYPHGLVNFGANCGDPGYTTTVTLYFYGVENGLTVRKYNPNTNAYFTITQATQTAQTIADQTVTVVSYQITDGGELDIDGEENGTIVDPVGLGILGVNVPNTGAQRIQEFLFVRN